MEGIFVASMVIVVLMVVVVICLFSTLNVVKRIKGPDDIKRSLNAYFEKKAEELAWIYADEKRLAQWIKELADSGDLNISKISDRSIKRAYALAVKKAENHLDLKMADLAHVRQEISDMQRELADSAEFPSTVKTCKEAIKTLEEQEALLEEEVDKAMKELENLKLC